MTETAQTNSTASKNLRRVKARPATDPAFPPIPPPTDREKASSLEISLMLRELAALAQQRNLDNAVQLAIQAATGAGPLVDHFAELGRRFSGELKPKCKPHLRVIQGGSVAQ